VDEFGTDTRRQVNGKRLWAGGAATACVAALVAILGILTARGLAKVEVLAPSRKGVWGDASTFAYAVCSGAAALAATTLLHLLLLTVPRPRTFFVWIMLLLTAIAVVVPLGLSANFDARVATALINVAVGFAITVTLSGLAGAAFQPGGPDGTGGDPYGYGRP
jgi:hypothetical protein